MKYPVLTFLMLVIALSLASCSKKVSSSLDVSREIGDLVLCEKKLENADLEISRVEGGGIVRFFPIQGNIVPNENTMAKIVPGISGIIRDLPHQTGDVVKKNDLLAVIESREATDLLYSYRENQRQAAFAQKQYEREKGFLEKQVTTRENYQSARNDMQKAGLELQLTKQKLRLLGMLDEKDRIMNKPMDAGSFFIRSPFAGTITARNAVLGEYSPSERELFVIMHLDTVWVEVRIPYARVSMVKTGQKIMVYNEKMDKKSPAVVFFVAPVTDVPSRTTLVRAELPNPEGYWRPGICVIAEFTESTRHVSMRLPVDAVVMIENRHSVFLEKSPGTFEMRSVVTGERNAEFVEITHGISPGDRVVTRHVLFLKGEWMARE